MCWTNIKHVLCICYLLRSETVLVQQSAPGPNHLLKNHLAILSLPFWAAQHCCCHIASVHACWSLRRPPSLAAVMHACAPTCQHVSARTCECPCMQVLSQCACLHAGNAHARNERAHNEHARTPESSPFTFLFAFLGASPRLAAARLLRVVNARLYLIYAVASPENSVQTTHPNLCTNMRAHHHNFTFL